MKKKLKWIPKGYYKKLSKSVRDELLEYRTIENLIKRKEKSLIKKLDNIKILKNELRLLKREETILFNKVKIFDDEFVPTISIVQNKKNDNVYWNCIVKIRGTIKSIYLGTDKKIRDYIKTNHNMRYNTSVEKIKNRLKVDIFDFVFESIPKNYQSFMNTTLRFEDII